MKKIAATLGVVLAASVGANAYQAAPNGAPSKPIYVQRVEQLLEASNVGDWKKACDAAPTAVYNYQDFVGIALLYGAQSAKDLGPVCEKILQTALTDLKGKPVGLTWEILWYEPDTGKEQANTSRKVIVRLKWGGKGQSETTLTFDVMLARIPWEGSTVKDAKGKPKPALRWYVVGAS